MISPSGFIFAFTGHRQDLEEADDRGISSIETVPVCFAKDLLHLLLGLLAPQRYLRWSRFRNVEEESRLSLRLAVRVQSPRVRPNFRAELRPWPTFQEFAGAIHFGRA